MREIVLDTETTGLDPAAGHRIVEIACIELVNRVPTGKRWQQYVNPERDMPEEAFRVHGLSAEFLAAHPVFADIAEAFVEFVADSPLVIHNAEFDLKFLNAELAILGRSPLDGREIIDTVKIARRKFPGAPASLDALCRRFAIDNSARDLHGALLDTELLAEVYLELMGGRQPALALVDSGQTSADSARTGSRTVRLPRPHDATPQEIAAHEAFIEAIKDPIWKR